jgi:hypothetical protein
MFEFSEKIGDPNKTVEIDETKFGSRKYNRGHAVMRQWVFGSVESESGKMFLVPVPDRTADTLMAVVTASNPALRLSVTTGWRTGICTRTILSTIPSVSLMSILWLIRTPSTARGVVSRPSSIHTIVWGIIFIISPTTCSPSGVSVKMWTFTNYRHREHGLERFSSPSSCCPLQLILHCRTPTILPVAAHHR